MSGSDRLPDYPLGCDLVRSLKSALDAGDEATVAALICTRVRPVDAVIELANDDWMKDPSAQLPPGALLGKRPASCLKLHFPPRVRDGRPFLGGAGRVVQEAGGSPGRSDYT